MVGSTILGYHYFIGRPGIQHCVSFGLLWDIYETTKFCFKSHSKSIFLCYQQSPHFHVLWLGSLLLHWGNINCDIWVFELSRFIVGAIKQLLQGHWDNRFMDCKANGHELSFCNKPLIKLPWPLAEFIWDQFQFPAMLSANDMFRFGNVMDLPKCRLSDDCAAFAFYWKSGF